MALFFFTDEPGQLLLGFKDAITQKKVVTWACDEDGDLTYTAAQWEQRAWFRPEVKREHLYMRILSPRGVRMSKVVYAVYHGRLIESMLTHCDDLFTRVRASANAMSDDIV